MLSTNKIKGFRAFLTLFLRARRLRAPNNDAPFIPYSLQMLAIPPTQGRGVGGLQVFFIPQKKD
nr:hypothetical protein [uncultured Desulfobulbus sp.]